MKIFCLLCFFIFLQNSNATDIELTSMVGFVPICMTVTQLNTANQILCGSQRSNATMWDLMIKCHRPIDDTFLRASNEATCPQPKVVADPTDIKYSLTDVFFNICGLVNGTYPQRGYGQLCIGAGHVSEVLAVQKQWGDAVPCNIGLCIKKMLEDAGYEMGIL